MKRAQHGGPLDHAETCWYERVQRSAPRPAVSGDPVTDAMMMTLIVR